MHNYVINLYDTFRIKLTSTEEKKQINLESICIELTHLCLGS